MTRHGYVDNGDLESLELGRWRGRVASAIRGRRGQKLLHRLKESLEAMPFRELIPEDLQDEHGGVCALGSIGVHEKLDLSELDPEESEGVAEFFDIADPMAREIVYENDEYFFKPIWKVRIQEKLFTWGSEYNENEQRWHYMYWWTCSKIKDLYSR